MSPSKGKDDSTNNNGIKPEQLLTPFQRKHLQQSLQADLRPEFRQRIEIMLLADQGKSQAEICRTLGCSQGTARYWIFIAQSGQAHNWKKQPVGRPKHVNEQYLERLRELVNHSPRDYGYAFSQWTAYWLSKHLAEEFDIEVSDRHINRLLKQMGLSTRKKDDADANGVDDDSHFKSSLNHRRKIVIDNLDDPVAPKSLVWQLFSSIN